jgi:hypothetical protein
MATTATHPRAGEIGEPERKWYIVPAVIPVPPPLPKEDVPAPDVEPIAEPEPEHVG